MFLLHLCIFTPLDIYTLEDLKWDKIILIFIYFLFIIMKHKTEDYKLSAVKYYLKHKTSMRKTCNIFRAWCRRAVSGPMSSSFVPQDDLKPYCVCCERADVAGTGTLIESMYIGKRPFAVSSTKDLRTFFFIIFFT